MISTNKLYDVDIIDDMDDESDNGKKSPGKKSSKKDFAGWIHQFNDNKGKSVKTVDRRGKRFSGSGPGLIKEAVFSE